MEFVFIASAHFMALLSPGPDFFLIVQTALRMTHRYAVALCCGIAVANGIYIALALSGLESIQGYEPLTRLLRFCGGGYLVFIGISLLLAPKRDLKGLNRGIIHRESFLFQFWVGFLSAILNPKNMIFYLSLFTIMVSEKTLFQTQVFYGLWMCSVVFIWDVCVALFLSREEIKKRYENGIVVIEKISGTALTLFGVFLSFS